MAVTEIPRHLLPKKVAESSVSQSEQEVYTRRIRDLIFWTAPNSLTDPLRFKNSFEGMKGELVGQMERMGDAEVNLLRGVSLEGLLAVSQQDLEGKAQEIKGVNPDQKKGTVVEITRLKTIVDFLEVAVEGKA